MVKKSLKISKKPETSVKKPAALNRDSAKLNAILIENFVSLQKALTNLTIKFESLSEQISKLLQLFEISAKSFAEKLEEGVPQIEKDREFLNKLNALLEQNKLIAKGLTLMEEKMRERLYGHSGRTSIPPSAPPGSPPRFAPKPSRNYLPSSLGEEYTE